MLNESARKCFSPDFRETRVVAVDAFLRTILEQPDADGPRLVFADWLEEHGDPHAELIRLQCELAHLPDTEPRRAGLQRRTQEITDQQDDGLQPIKALGL